MMVLIVLGFSTQGMGQGLKLSQPNAVGGSLVGTHLDGLVKSSSMGPGLEVFLKYNVSPRFMLSAGTGILTATDGTLSMENFRTTLFPTVEVRAGYGLTEGSKFLPFIYGGLQAFGFKSTTKTPSYTSDTFYDAGAIIGGGFEYALNELWSIHATGDYRYIFTASTPTGVSKPQYWMAKAGLTYALQPGERQKREEIEYPTGEGEISLDDLFNQEVVAEAESDEMSEDDALALLFQTEEEIGDMETIQPEERAAGETEETLYPVTSSTGTSLNARVQELRTEMDRRTREINDLQNQVTANERSISQFSGQVAGQTEGSFGVYNTANFKANYESALQNFYNKQFQDAIRIFRGLMTSNPDHRLASNCQYWIGESYNAMKQYQEALNAFNSVMSYRTSYKFDDALIMSGICHLRLGDRTTARENFQQLVSRFPDSEYAPKAMRYLGRL